MELANGQAAIDNQRDTSPSPAVLPYFVIHHTITTDTMATEAAARKFFTSPFFAVVGASSNPAKFGHKGSFVRITPVDPPYAYRFTRLTDVGK